jgi:hypothetical protein
MRWRHDRQDLGSYALWKAHQRINEGNSDIEVTEQESFTFGENLQEWIIEHLKEFVDLLGCITAIFLTFAATPTTLGASVLVSLVLLWVISLQDASSIGSLSNPS